MTVTRRLEPGADHIWFGALWTADDATARWSVAWAPETGELLAVGPTGDPEVLGVIDERRRVEELMAGWDEAQQEPGSLYGLRDRVSRAVARVEVARDEPPSARRRDARYRVDLDDGRWWELGWDPPQATFYAHLHDPVPFDPFTPPDLLASHGAGFGELPDLDSLEGATGLRLDRDIGAELAADQAAFPNGPPSARAAADVGPPEPRDFESWVGADPDRRNGHVDLGSKWIGGPADVRRLGWIAETGEVYAVDGQEGVEVLGVIPTRPLLDAALRGAGVRHGVDGGLHWARGAVRQAEEELLFGRVGGPDGTHESWVAAQEARRVPHHDFGDGWSREDAARLHRLSWVPTTGELYVAACGSNEEAVVEVLGVFATAADVEEAIPGWAQRMSEEGSLYWLRDAVARGIAQRFDLAAASPEGIARRGQELQEREAQLDARERTLDRRERQLIAQHEAVGTALPVEPRWSLPAAPVAEILVALQAGTGEDMPMVAKGCGLDPAWAADVAAGRIVEVDLPHVQEVCEGLHCSPYDLWGKDDAQGIVHAYGPELWPRFIEPLEPPPVELPGPEPGLEL